MKTPLQIIADLGCPTDSYNSAIQYLLQRDASKHVYEQRIQELIGLEELPHHESWYAARTMFMYVVQETIRTYALGLIPIMEDIETLAEHKTAEYISASPWNETRFNLEHGLAVSEELDEEGTPTSSKKGAKKEVTEALFLNLKSKGATRQAIIDAFVAETGMSKAGATTYFHTLKKEHGFKEATKGEKKASKPESKQDLAERLYQEAEDKSKSAMITLFTEKLETSKLGAQTYFYACKKKLEPLTA